MENTKTITYTIELDSEKYQTLPIIKAHFDQDIKSSAEDTALILIPYVTDLKEVNIKNQSYWRQQNLKALIAWAGSGNFLGEKTLMQQSQGKDDTGTEIFVVSKIKGIP